MPENTIPSEKTVSLEEVESLIRRVSNMQYDESKMQSYSNNLQREAHLWGWDKACREMLVRINQLKSEK